MSAPRETAQKDPDLNKQEAAQDISTEVERLVRDRTAELQTEIDTLRYENETLKHVERDPRKNEDCAKDRSELNVIYTSAPIGLCLLGTDTRYLRINQRFAEMNGFSIEEHIGKRVRDLVPGLAEEAEALARKVVETGEPVLDIEIHGETPSQPGVTRYWKESWLPLKDDSGLVVAINIIAEETTEQKRLQEELIKANVKLEDRVRDRTAELERSNTLFQIEIEERDRVEIALQESKEKLQTLFQLLPVGISVLDEHRKILDANPTLENILGLSRDCLLHEAYNNRRYIRPDGTDMPVAEFPSSRVITEQTAIRNVEIGIETEGGSTIWTNVSAVPLPFSDWRMLLTTSDITERKHMEEALRESEEKFRALVEHSLDGTLILDPKGNILSVNRAAVRLVGIEDPDEVSGRRNVMEFVAPVSQDDVIKDFGEVAKGTDAYIARYKILTVAQEERWVESIGKSIVYKGAPAILISLRDITKRRQAEAELRTTKEYLENLIGYANAPIIVWNPEFFITRFNQAFESLTGIPVEEAVGARLEILFPEESRDASMEMIRRTMAGERWDTVEIPIMDRSGSVRTVLWNSANITGHGGTLLATIAQGQDITERKQVEEERAVLHRQLEAAHREANLYLDILTHDIGNTENVSNLYTELLMDIMEGEAAEYVERLRRSISKSIEILGTVSKIRRIHHGLPDIRPVDLEAVIREEIGHFPDVTIRYEGAPWSVLADDLFSEVFANLIGNAVKHGGPGVEITIRTQEENGFVRVSIEDTGPGVPDDQKKEIFHRYKKKRRGVGEGLGLYLVQILVDRYGGTIFADDRVAGHPEQGAAFRFTLKKAT